MAKGGYQKRRIAEKKQRERKARRKAERRKKMMTGLVIVVLLGAIGGIAFVAATGGDGDLASNAGCDTPGTASDPKSTYDQAPEDTLDPDVDYTATFVTSCGTIEVDLYEEDAPKTVNNFVFLARDGYYDGSIFHRVIDDFAGVRMAQGGDAVNLDGTGGPGYQFEDENMVPFATAGLLAMANSGAGTNGSQFFILDGPVSHLNAPDPDDPTKSTCPPTGGQGCHSVFGQVTAGLDVIGLITGVETAVGDKPVNDVVLISVTINEQPKA